MPDNSNYILHVLTHIMKTDTHTDGQIRDILSLRRVAVIGMSRDPAKAAHYVPRYLSENGYDVIPVNPAADEIMGRRAYGSVLEIQNDVDVIEIFRPSDQVMPFVQEAIQKRPKVIWLQEGIHNQDAEDLAAREGIPIVFNRCMLAEHRRLLS